MSRHDARHVRPRLSVRRPRQCPCGHQALRSVGEEPPSSSPFADDAGGEPWMKYSSMRAPTLAGLAQSGVRVGLQRRHGDQAYPELITRLLKATDPETGRAMSDRDVVDNVLTFITAGHETTALALTWTFYLLSLHPEIEERAVQEVEAVTKGGTLREGHVEALSYTRQVVLEAMRLYPPAPVVVRT